MTSRLEQLESRLTTLNEQLAGLETALDLSPMEEQTRLKQRIKKLRTDMAPVEAEKWQILAANSAQLEITEPEAEVIVGELVTQVSQLETQATTQQNEAILQVLHEIRAQLDRATLSSPDKVRGALSSFPPFIGVFYEADLDSPIALPKSFGGFCQQYFPTFTGSVEKLAGLLRAQSKK